VAAAALSPVSLAQSSDGGRDLSPAALGATWIVSPHPAGDHGHDKWSASRPDGHAPIGVMGDHMHGAGEWMVSVRAMRMHMDGMRDDQDRLSDQQVFDRGFMITPTEMDMDMLMFGGMYAPTDDLTLSVMVPFIENTMDHATASGGRFSTRSSGVGDVAVGGLYSLFEGDGHRVHLNAAVSIPTGSVTERDDTPAMQDAKLPYPMQLGTGTWDLLPGLTWLLQRGDWSFGAQGIFRFHLGTNSEEYRRGNRIDATAWGARRAGPVSFSLRVAAAHWDDLQGSDPDLPPPTATVVPTARPDLQGGDRVDVLLGVNSHGLGGHRLAAEVGLPAYQDLNGPQLETDWLLTLGYQYSF